MAKQQQVTSRKRESHALKKVGGQLHRLVLETALLRHPRKVDNARREDTRHASSSKGVALFFVCDLLLLLFLFVVVFVSCFFVVIANALPARSDIKPWPADKLPSVHNLRMKLLYRDIG